MSAQIVVHGIFARCRFRAVQIYWRHKHVSTFPSNPMTVLMACVVCGEPFPADDASGLCPACVEAQMRRCAVALQAFIKTRDESAPE
jgi:predicted RNA-binding Zn-ribbon protein involved in translation (DUF1610 family)